MLGIISDMSFMHNGVKDPYAGYKFGQYVRKTGLIIPFVLESSEASNHVYAKELNASFIDKNSKSYPQDLKKKIMQRFGFGDFVILNPHTKEEIMRIKDLKDLQRKSFRFPTTRWFTISPGIISPVSFILVPCFHPPRF